MAVRGLTFFFFSRALEAVKTTQITQVGNKSSMRRLRLNNMTSPSYMQK